MTFEVEADRYDRFMGRYSTQLAPQLADLGGVRAGQRVLDVGCGPGAVTAELVHRVGDNAVSAVDPSEAFVAAARARYPGVDVGKAPAEALPFENSSFDATLAQLVVHFMADPVVRDLSRARKQDRPSHTLPAMKKDYFGAEIAESYDDDGPMFAAEVLGPTVDFLAALAGDGAALEFGIGTGRVALSLAERGVRVCGIDLSEAMVAKLRAKPGAEPVDATIGDFATARVDGKFSLVYLVFNTICNLTTQDDQVACFQNAADHLETGGCFVIEVVTPDLQRVSPGERFYPFDVSSDHVGLDEYDVANQGLVSHHLWPEGDGWRRASIPFRYVWPAELDLMARLAGMRLRERWQDWDRSPFTSESRKHVSVWERAG